MDSTFSEKLPGFICPLAAWFSKRVTLYNKSRVMGDYQARFRERLEGKFLRPTRPVEEEKIFQPIWGTSPQMRFKFLNPTIFLYPKTPSISCFEANKSDISNFHSWLNKKLRENMRFFAIFTTLLQFHVQSLIFKLHNRYLLYPKE